MTPHEQFTQWLDECPCPWLLIEDHADSKTFKFFPDETCDEEEPEDDWNSHPSLTAAERNPSLR